MASYMIQRENYKAEYAYFIDHPWLIESLGVDLEGVPLFAVRVSSEVDSLETLQAILDNHAALTVVADKTTIQADGADSVTWSIAGQTVFDYRLFKNNIEIAAGTVSDGSLVFNTDQPELYSVELKIGSQTGYGQVVAE